MSNLVRIWIWSDNWEDTDILYWYSFKENYFKENEWCLADFCVPFRNTKIWNVIKKKIKKKGFLKEYLQ